MEPYQIQNTDEKFEHDGLGQRILAQIKPEKIRYLKYFQNQFGQLSYSFFHPLCSLSIQQSKKENEQYGEECNFQTGDRRCLSLGMHKKSLCVCVHLQQHTNMDLNLKIKETRVKYNSKARENWKKRIDRKKG